MKNSAFQLAEEIRLREIGYKLHNGLWSKYDLSPINLDFSTWSSIKYLNDGGTDFSDEINLLPNKQGGLYLFYVKCPIISGITEFPFYIGRAQLTDGQNLRKRCKEYFSKFAREDERPKITKMIKYWGKELYLAFKVIDGNDHIVDYEKKLINSLLLPMNDEIPDTEIKQAIKAF